MALRDQPYLPLYIQDFLTDEKLSECSAASTGVYIRLMCLMHKSEHYGKILLKQKHKQTGKQIEDFAFLFAKSMPYDSACIVAALTELVEERVIKIEGDFMVQKRMVEDNELSLIRSASGKKGGEQTQINNKSFAKANSQPNTEYENDIENKEKKEDMVVAEMMKIWMQHKPRYAKELEKDSHCLLALAYKIAEYKGWKKAEVVNKREKDILASWEKIVKYVVADQWYSTKSLTIVNSQWQSLVEQMDAAKNGTTVKKTEPPVKIVLK